MGERFRSVRESVSKSRMAGFRQRVAAGQAWDVQEPEISGGRAQRGAFGVA